MDPWCLLACWSLGIICVYKKFAGIARLMGDNHVQKLYAYMCVCSEPQALTQLRNVHTVSLSVYRFQLWWAYDGENMIWYI